MAVIIPSKNIYSKENPKVINNVINKIETEENNISIVDDFDTIAYSKDFDLNKNDDKSNHPIELHLKNTNATNYQVITGISGNYTSIKLDDIIINRQENNKYIRSIYDWWKDNNTPVQIGIEYEKEEYSWVTTYDEAEDKFDYTPRNVSPEKTNVYNYDGIGFKRELAFNVGNAKDINASHEIQLLNPSATYVQLDLVNAFYASVPSYAYEYQTLNATIKKSLSQIVTPETSVDTLESRITIDLHNDDGLGQILFNLDATLCTSFIYNAQGNFAGEYNASASRVVLKCKRITLTAYGDTQSIEIENVPKILGNSNGELVYKHPSNELLQSSNYFNILKDGDIFSGEVEETKPATEYFLNKTLSHYKNGKETATLRCSIGDYYSSVNLKETMFQNIEKSNSTYTFNTGFKPLQIGLQQYDASHNWISHLDFVNLKSTGEILIKFTKTSSFERLGIRVFNDATTNEYAAVIFDAKNLEDNSTYLVCINVTSLTDTYLSFEIPYIKDLTPYIPTTTKMTFDIDDEVIPYVYGANGQDRAMSYYKDGTPKVFKVLGNKIFYDGAVWQELYLQEV